VARRDTSPAKESSAPSPPTRSAAISTTTVAPSRPAGAPRSRPAGSRQCRSWRRPPCRAAARRQHRSVPPRRGRWWRRRHILRPA